MRRVRGCERGSKGVGGSGARRGRKEETKREWCGESARSSLLRGSWKGARSVMRIVSRGGRGRRGRRLTQRASLAILPVTCTSRVCLPASRSASYLHSTDEAATVPGRPARRSLPAERFACTRCAVVKIVHFSQASVSRGAKSLLFYFSSHERFVKGFLLRPIKWDMNFEITSGAICKKLFNSWKRLTWSLSFQKIICRNSFLNIDIDFEILRKLSIFVLYL